MPHLIICHVPGMFMMKWIRKKEKGERKGRRKEAFFVILSIPCPF